MAFLSNILAAYSFIADQPEQAALVFLGGVCVGLLVTLWAVVFQIHCRADCNYGNSNNPPQHHRIRHHHHHRCPRHQRGDSNPDRTAVVVSAEARPTRDSASEDWDEASDPLARRRRHYERGLLHTTMFTSAEELDRAQRLEERERILREIWMNGQPDISTVTQSLNRYY